MHYIMNKYCRGNFILSTNINLNDFMNQDEQEKFFHLRKLNKNEITKEESDWLKEVYESIEEQSCNFTSFVSDYDIDDYDWYKEEDEMS